VAENVRILLVGSDANLRSELAEALTGLAEVSAVTYTADGPTAADTARTRRPDLVLFELTSDLKAARHLVEDLHAVVPGTVIAAAFRPDLFGPDVSEAAFFIEAIRAGVQDFLRRPLSSADLGQLLQRIDRPTTASPSVHGKVVCFVSNKGGVGKSTLAVSTACLLAKRNPGRVLLVDASLQMGVCATLLNLRPPTTLHDAVREWDRLDETLIRRLAVPHDCGLHLLAAPADAEEAAAIDDRIIGRVVALARRSYEFVVVDTFPLLDRVVLAVLDLSDRVYIALENVVPTVLGAVQLVKLFDRFGFPADRQRVVLNRFDSGSGGPAPADVAARLGRTVDHVVPYTKKIITAANLGEPYALHASSWWGFGKALRGVVDDVANLTAVKAPARRVEAERADQ
jgi:pilus assembly protein CpaE